MCYITKKATETLLLECAYLQQFAIVFEIGHQLWTI